MKTLSITLAFIVAISASAEEPAKKLNASQRIDQLVEANYAKHGITPNPPASDEIFIRRIYLDIAGRIPTFDETNAFLADKRKNKKAVVINTLLNSEGYVAHFYNYWADLLRAKTRISGAGNSTPAGMAYGRWIKDSLRENKPYNEMVHELLSSSGNIWNDPAVGYYLRDYGMSLDNLAVTSQVFLGTQIVCAQCHDHPFDTWTQMDYYHLAAFTKGMVTTNQAPNARSSLVMMNKRAEDRGKKLSAEKKREVARAFSEILKPVRFTQVYQQDRSLRLPHDYQYDDAKPKALVDPKVPFAPGAAVSEGEHPIGAFAAWMTSPENPRFTKVISNRLWKKALGLGLIEPVDDLREDTAATNPELMKFLENRMVAFDYDMKKFLRMIYNTETYQREASPKEPALGEPYHFAGPILRRMTAEQIWDSILAMTVEDVDYDDGGGDLFIDKRLAQVELVANAVYDKSPSEFLRDARAIVEVQKSLAEDLQKTQEKLAAARESKDTVKYREAVAEAGRIRRNLVAEIEKKVYLGELNEKVTLVASLDPKAGLEAFEKAGAGDTMIDSADFIGDLASVVSDSEMEGYAEEGGVISSLVNAMFSERLEELNDRRAAHREQQMAEFGLKTKEEQRVYRDFSKSLSKIRRACDSGSPAPPGHFLREFGQSDRELVDNANDSASVTQALSLLNGRPLTMMTHRLSALSRDIRKVRALDERLDVIYLSMLSRKPTDTERAMLAEAFGKEMGSGGMPGVIWTLLNTRQFLFVQ